MLLPAVPIRVGGRVQFLVIELAAGDFAPSVNFQNISGEYTDRFYLPQIQVRIFQPFSQDFLCAGLGIQADLRQVI